MDIQDFFYLTGIIFFLMVIVYLLFLILFLQKIRKTIDTFSEKTVKAAETVMLAKYSLKAGLLKLFLSFLGEKGGEKNL